MQRFDHVALRRYRLQAGLSREQLAVAVGKSYRSVACYELGEANPRVEGLERIADILGIKPGDLFSEQS